MRICFLGITVYNDYAYQIRITEMNAHQNPVDTFFKLLVPIVEPISSGIKTIELSGKLWTLVDFERPSDAPPYTCISYSWEKEKMVNPLNNKQTISARSISVIETVIKSLESTECLETEIQSMFHGKNRISEKLTLAHKASYAIWVDALCRPVQQPAANICIQNMGEIYKAATQLFIVLNNNCLDTVYKVHNKDPLNLDDYLMLAGDNWIDRVWTYQEFANSKMMFLVAEGKGNTFVSDARFLNALAIRDAVYTDIKNIELTQKLERWQLLIAEQYLVERSAFLVMSAINRRFCLLSRPEDRINAMISVVSDVNTDTKGQNLTTPSEYFMQLCEKNNDFSFIFSTNPRSEVLGKGWRPLDTQLTPVISDVFVYESSGLSGVVKDTHLQMNNMCRMIPWKSNSVIYAIESLLKADFPKELFEMLTQRGFAGCGEYIELEHGYFFPQHPHKHSKNLFVAVSHDVRFHQGAPGLLLYSNDTDINQFCDTGVFIGKLPKNKETINIS